jgi:hypothetical protein
MGLKIPLTASSPLAKYSKILKPIKPNNNIKIPRIRGLDALELDPSSKFGIVKADPDDDADAEDADARDGEAELLEDDDDDENGLKLMIFYVYIYN